MVCSRSSYLGPTAAGILALAVGCGSGSVGTGTSQGDESTGATTDTGTGTDTDGQGVGLPPIDALRQILAARCGWLFECCTRGEVDYELGPFTNNPAECVDRAIQALAAGNLGQPVDIGPIGDLVQMNASWERGWLEIDPVALNECVIHHGQMSCTDPPPDEQEGPEHCTPDDDEGQDDPCELDHVVIGRQQVGEECTPFFRAECGENLRCANLGERGICVAQGADGEACFSDDECADPLLCQPLSGSCSTGSQLGEPCQYANPGDPQPGTEAIRCAEELSCDPTTFTCVGACATGSPCFFDEQCPIEHLCVFGHCQLPQPGGAPCEFAGQCMSGYCDFIEGVCAPVVGNGGPCEVHSQCSSEFCNPVVFECAATVDPGQPCPTYYDEECKDGFCDLFDIDNPVCVGYAAEGQSCDFETFCNPDLELECLDGTCVVLPLPDGHSCGADFQCESTLCWMSVCSPGAMGGEACSDFDVEIKPCDGTLFCQYDEEGNGTCQSHLGTGDPCYDAGQCWGQCIINWGVLMCDKTPGPEEAWCDGV